MSIPMSIMGKTYQVECEQPSINKVDFDCSNPRLMESRNGTLTEERIREIFFADSDTDDLIDNIKSMGGLLRPPIAMKVGGRYIPRDGNRRVYSYKMLNEEYPSDVRWKTIPVFVLPRGISEETVQALVGVIHSTLGEKDWPAYCKVAHIVKWRREYDHSIEDVENNFGLPPSEYKLKESTYDISTMYMDDTGDKDPHWSQWYEAIGGAENKIPEALKNNQKKRELCFLAMKDGKMKNPHLSRSLKYVIDSIPALRRMCKDGIEAAVSQVRKDKLPADSFFNSLQRTRTSLMTRREELVKRLKLASVEDVNKLSEFILEFGEVLRESGHSSILELWED